MASDSQGRVIRITAKMDSITTPIVPTVLWQSELSDYSNGNIAGQNITGNHGARR